jgi:hypothetical protein
VRHGYRTLTLVVSLILVSALSAQEQRGFMDLKGAAAAAALHDPQKQADCRGRVTLVTDAGFEGVKTTNANFAFPMGGGESGRFDKTPVLSTRVELREGCLNAHLSAIVGSRQTYGPGVASIALFQVTLTPSGGGAPQHMYGHYETPYGMYGPAVAVEAERDVDMLGANFFQRIGDDQGEVKPGVYDVDVWWAGGPIGGGGAIGAAFVLKLYQ